MMKEEMKTFKKVDFSSETNKKVWFCEVLFTFEGRGNKSFLMKNGHYKIVQAKSIKDS